MGAERGLHVIQIHICKNHDKYENHEIKMQFKSPKRARELMISIIFVGRLQKHVMWFIPQK